MSYAVMPPMLSFRLPTLALLPALSLCVASTVHAADTVCIGFDKTAFAAGSERGAAAGHLDARQCFAVAHRGEGSTRIFLHAAGAFRGEVEVPNDKLAYVLVDDTELRLDPKEPPWGRIVGGTIVVQEGAAEGDLVVRPADGRVRPRFRVADTALYPAEIWPYPDPKEPTPPQWPQGLLVAPPVPGTLQSTAAGGSVRVEVGSPSASIDVLQRDPGRGVVRFDVMERDGTDLQVRIQTQHLWATGWVPELDWRNEPPAEGWDPGMVAPVGPAFVTPAREIGSTGAPISRAVKGEPFGELLPGARVDVGDADGSWVGVTARWPGGAVSGWIQKKFLVKEGKEQPAPPVAPRIAALSLGEVSTQWELADGHEASPVIDTTPIRKRLAEHTPGLRWSYAQVLATDPKAAGLVTVRLLVDPAGKLLECSVPAATLQDEALHQAALAAFRDLSFEKRKVVKKKGGPADFDVVLWVPLQFTAGS